MIYYDRPLIFKLDAGVYELSFGFKKTDGALF